MAVRRLAIHVAQVGAWLVAAKQKCQHGEWLGWLGENCPEISQDTAERYRKVYLRYSAEMRNLTVTQAYRELGIVKDPVDKLEVEPPPLPEGVFDVIVIDPPWQIAKQRRTHASIGTAAYYHEKRLCAVGEH